MGLFKCKHPFESLIVLKDATETPVDKDFISISYYFICGKCDEKLTMTYAKVIGSAEAFFDRAKNKNE